MNLKKYIAEKLNVSEEAILNAPKKEMGDLSFPCFVLAKELKKSPMVIAGELQQLFVNDDLIEKTEIVGGYLNFFFNKQKVGSLLFDELKNFELKDIGKGKVVCIDYCAVNLAKYLHIGHFTTTIIGESLARIHEALGYKVVRINYVGDYGTPFGKMVVAYKLWGNENDIRARGIDAVQDLYVKFCANENEELMDLARQASAKIEKQEDEEYQIYKNIIDITIEETKRLVGRMNIAFDDWRGESTYNNQMEEPLKQLKDAGLLTIGEENAEIVDLNDFGLGVCVLKRGDGASLYVTRDLAAVEDRYNLYNFDKMLYVTAVQQNNHFAKLFKLCELVKKPYANKLLHVSYGMFSLPEGKIASRKGKQALFADILDEAETSALKAVETRNLTDDQKQNISKAVAMSAIAFSILKIERVKDKVFDMQKAISFDGETGPYLQYTYARLCSLIRKYQTQYEFDDNAELQITDDIFELLKSLEGLKDAIVDSCEKCEPCYLARKLLEIAQLFNKYYNENKIVTADKNESAGKINFVIRIKQALEVALKLVCIKPIEEM
ncbi:MAG: arginine--tRNA ligase [Clostridiales bacterium]|nr:arginine--tRNA ligase [Clostridiales bacterium]